MKTRSHFQRISSLFKGATLAAIALVSFVSPPAGAESHTNAVLQATFALTAYIQESKDTNNPVWTTSSRSFGNSDIINAIATDFGLPASDYTSNSLVLLSTDVATTNSHLGYALRSTSGVDTDISTNLAINLPNLVVTAIRAAPFGRTTNSTDLTIFEFSLDTTNISFDIQGSANLQSSSILMGTKVIDKSPFTTSFNATVAGSATIDGKTAILKGTVRAFNRKIEVKDTP